MRIGVVLVNRNLARAVERALSGGEHTLVWSTANAADGLRRVATDPPEVVLVGVDVQDMTAAELTRRLLLRGNTAVLLVAARGSEAISSLYDAMDAGAIDVVALPESGAARAETELVLGKLRTAKRLLGGTGSSATLPKAGSTTVAATTASTPPLIALGASTGGPQALLTILKAFRRDTRAAIVIVQHVDAEFSAGLATWLHESTELTVEIARPGASPVSGTALVAGTKDHLIIGAGGTFRYTPDPRDLPYRPSVDVLFGSLAEHWRSPAAAALLTGMGRDGANGLHRLKNAGWLTLAQDEASSVVYGMPKAAVQIGAARRVLSPQGIAAELVQFAESR